MYLSIESMTVTVQNRPKKLRIVLSGHGWFGSPSSHPFFKSRMITPATFMGDKVRYRNGVKAVRKFKNEKINARLIYKIDDTILNREKSDVIGTMRSWGS